MVDGEMIGPVLNNAWGGHLVPVQHSEYRVPRTGSDENSAVWPRVNGR